MGNEESRLIDEDVRPKHLEARNLDAVAKYIKDTKLNRVVLMVGAGISTSAGIPDFRSPDTGLYANLAKLDLEEPEDVFDISFFRQNPKPFYALAHELYPGRYYPTIAHAFVKLLHDKGMLLKHFTQNIDCLERQAGVPAEKIIEAHGSFATQRCIDCKEPYPDDLMRELVAKTEVPHCLNEKCNGLVKPDIVFFGEALPKDFHDNNHLPSKAELCIVMGTSLTVQPFASLPDCCDKNTPRVLINMQRVGSLGSRSDDVLVLGDIDEGVRKFARALGWETELEAVWMKVNPKAAAREAEDAPLQTRDERLHDEIDRLTAEVDRTLDISDKYEQRVREKLGEGKSKEQDSANSTQPEYGLAHVFPHFAHQSR